MCPTGKREFQGPAQAKKAWAKMWAHRTPGSKKVVPLSAYKCTVCPFWHLTSRDWKDRRAIRSRKG